MPNRPAITTEMRKRKRETHDAFTVEINNAVKSFFTSLYNIVEKYRHTRPYMLQLAGLTIEKKLSKQNPTPYSVFCGMKLQEVNINKDDGHKTTLPIFLTERRDELSTEYNKLSNTEKENLVTKHHQTKGERGDTAKKLTSTAVSRAVNEKMRLITNMCNELNTFYKTKSLFFCSRNDVSHNYPPGSYASPGACNWLANAMVGRDTPENIAYQMEGYIVSGCGNGIKNGVPAKASQRQSIVRSQCREIVQKGLVSILKGNDHPAPDKKMNYANYESKIVEELGVALIGWPGDGKVENPGSLGPDKCLALRAALEKNQCKWVTLTEEEQEARKRQNAQREQNGEMVYGPPRKKRARLSAPENEHVEEERLV